jgi:hypothetical protein
MCGACTTDGDADPGAALRPAILAAFILSLTRLLSFETEVFLGTSSGSTS